MTFSTQDQLHMQRALKLANEALYLTSPNPRVGCVLVSSDGLVIGEGHTQRAGQAHAEVAALDQAIHNGLDTKGSTAYVTLEPCSHTGRTPPCTEALVNAGVSRVVASLTDPNPLVSGKGFERLRLAGIKVDLGLGEQEAYAINAGFIKRMTQGVPLVRLKIASSLDGTTALANGKSKWITGEISRTHAHQWRARSCAILSGIGTVLSDDPSLNVRLVRTERQPKLILIDAGLQIPTNATLLKEKREVIIYCASSNTEKERELNHRGVTVINLADKRNPNHVDLQATLIDLGKKEINELHIEAGAGLNASFIGQGLVDEYLIYFAPMILGQAKGWANLPVIEELSRGVALSFLESLPLGQDIFIRARSVIV